MRILHTLCLIAIGLGALSVLACDEPTSSGPVANSGTNGGANTSGVDDNSACTACGGTDGNSSFVFTDSCEYANDGECDEPGGFCAPGTDSTDCGNPVTSTNGGTTGGGTTGGGTTGGGNTGGGADPLACQLRDLGAGPQWEGTVSGNFSGPEGGALTGITEAHNALRRFVGVPNLTWSVELAASAQQWADNLANNQSCGLVHDQGNFGENLWQKWSSNAFTVNPAEVVGGWSCEREDWDNNAATCQGQPGYKGTRDCGHYTQVVWRETTEVGCGLASCQNGQEWVVVCRYGPAGNVNNRAPY